MEVEDAAVWELFERGLAIAGLLGRDGLRPVQEALRSIRVRWSPGWRKSLYLALYRNPTVFWLASSDMALKAACALGALAAALLVAFPSLHPLLSLVTVLGPFILLTEPMMVELSVLAAVLSPLKYTHTSLPLLAAYSCHLPSAVLRLFVFRLMLSAGLVKWFGSPKWRDLTAMEVHYETQPLPNRLSFYFHLYTPKWAHKMSTLVALVVELPLCFLVFYPSWEGRLLVFVANAGLMAMINLTGNYGHLGLTTVVASIPLLDDWMLPSFLQHASSSDKVTASAWVELAVVTYAAAYLVLSIVPLVDVTKTRPLPDVVYWLYGLVSPYCLVNVYGMFAGLHDKRWELVVEGSDDGQTDWRRYGFYFKPSRPSHLPLIVTPPTYWPRLDWHLWIIPLSVQKGNPLPPEWYKAFLAGLLKNTPAVLALVQHNPFTDKPPAYIRTRICEYAFAQRGKGRREGDWWVERDLGVYGGELAYDLDNLWTLGIDVTKHLDLPNKDKSGVTSYKVSM
ncbi:uncharacterized protein ACA1_143690 [Acanthamoeba castellanii str. Neff]|uniref:Transmembrane protein n=1 Tax=Acanthamoeba castellanii (strain ATCC 30010 / Neff) TaxID=1257118 RepID=L8HEN6_ACACF|nr:uncharacterized protein ACA1_143690 [Acanthamoeba castellanii str. Neff]ELR23989.1 transmembrane protein [Acanthamoeba castellanii str. Neff]